MESLQGMMQGCMEGGVVSTKISDPHLSSFWIFGKKTLDCRSPTYSIYK